MIKAAGYIRVSTPIQVKEGESLTTQEEAIKIYSNAKGLELVEMYADKGISGASIQHRYGLIKLLKDAKENKFDCIIIHRLSRFGRNARDILNIVYELKKNAVKLISIKEDLDFSTKVGNIMLIMLGAIAELEREVIGEQMSENKVARWRRHEIFIGKPPFGYIWNKEKKILEINSSEADIFKRIVSMYLDEGMSFRDIGIKLQNEGVRCKKAYFNNTTISYMLKNPAYYGHYVLNQWKYKGNKRQNEGKSAQENISFPIPALIDKLTWDKIQDKTSFNKVKSKRITAARDYWLRDILQCRECGSAIKPHHGFYRKDGTFPRYYSCYWASTSQKNLISARKEKCILPTIKADALEALIWDIIGEKLSFHRWKEIDKSSGKFISKHKKYISEIIEPEHFDAKIKDLEEVNKTLARELIGKELAKKKLYSTLEDDVPFDKEEFYNNIKEYNDIIITLKANISNNNQQLILSKKAKDNAYSLREFMHKNDELLDNIMKELANLGPDDKKLLVESLVEDKIEVFKKGESECLRLVSWEGEPVDWCLVPFRLVFNPNVFQRLISEDKIPSIKSKWSPPSCRR